VNSLVPVGEVIAIIETNEGDNSNTEPEKKGTDNLPVAPASETKTVNLVNSLDALNN
jgi:pyruvate/2-oxoglutarate dehydrogenase complex dihydrolipoamide acyltransferase (E2) component